ncbi:hypothetical protein [Acetobacter persici]|uniref:hypothetical protein n=1 Tax=Acetobacter persici TaxID=1076596 RepID=UPI0039E90154
MIVYNILIFTFEPTENSEKSIYYENNTMNDLINCFSVIHMPQMQVVSVDACTAARATIRAAEIQAKAARSAGLETLFAGTLAFLASIVATLLTYKIASAESKRVEKNRAIISKAYVIALHALIFNVLEEAKGLVRFLQELSQQGELRDTNGVLINQTFLDLRFHRAMRDALALNRSDDLSKLPDTAIINAVGAKLAVDQNIELYTSIESFLNNEAKNPRSENYLEIRSLCLRYDTEINENIQIIYKLYTLLIPNRA